MGGQLGQRRSNLGITALDRNGTVGYWNPLSTRAGERTQATKSLVPSSLRF
jgi:hypothetical protein